MHGCWQGVCMVAGGGACMVKGGHVWDTTTYGNMINERAVSILLECIVVLNDFPI